jgi:WD40 repeat protein
MPIRNLPANPDLFQYKKQAKQLLKASRSGDRDAARRFRDHHPHARRLPAPSFQLSDAQWVLAREHGFDSWRAFTVRVRELNAQSTSSASRPAVVHLQVPSSREVNLGVFLRGDGRMLTATEAEPVRLWDGMTGALIREFGTYSHHAWAIRVADDNRTLFVGCRDGAVRVVDLERDHLEHVLTGHRDLVRCLDITPDHRNAISGGMRDRELRWWDVGSAQCLRVMTGHRDGIYSVALDPTQTLALSGSRDTTVRLWDLDRGECIRIFEGHRYHVHDIAWSVDGRRALSCSQDIRLWDVATGRSIRVLEGHTETIRSVAWSPNQQLALSAAHDRTVRVWDVETARCLHVLSGHSAGVIRAAWTSDRRIVSCDWSGEVRSWDLG